MLLGTGTTYGTHLGVSRRVARGCYAVDTRSYNLVATHDDCSKRTSAIGYILHCKLYRLTHKFLLTHISFVSLQLLYNKHINKFHPQGGIYLLGKSVATQKYLVSHDR